MSRSSVAEDEEPLMNVTSNSDSTHEGNGNGGPLSWIGMQTAFHSPLCHPLPVFWMSLVAKSLRDVLAMLEGESP